jgi:EAL domain-containing protein (putative c-di-GMP-specific phosphodiesterase class I)
VPDDSSQILRFLGLAFAGADLVFEVDLDGSIAFALGAAERLTGRKDSSLVGRNWLELFGPDDEDFLNALLHGLAQGDRRGPVRVGLRQADKDLPPRQATLSLFRLPQISQRISCALSLGGASALDHGVHSNAGLVEKDAFAEGFGALLEEAERAGLDLRLDLVELAGFEGGLAKLDDETAERKRRQIAAVLRSESFAGYGASEVTTDRFALVRAAGASETALTDRLRADSGVEPVTAQLPLGGTAAENVRTMRYALDRYIEDGPEATAQGFKAMIERTVRDSTRFKTIVANSAFNLAYQPVVDLRDDSLHHFEALARFDPNVSPAESIRLAEELDMISDFDLAVVASVLKVLASDTGRDASIAANISARSLSSEQFVIELAALCGDAAGLRPRLLLELTETHQITDFDQANGALAHLRRLGHKVCLDDFGAGACSLEYLRRLDVDYVKIDGRYVQELVAGSRDAMILKHVVALCDEMDVATIAEMIETREAAGVCKDLGVTLGQGWVFAKPLPKPVWSPPEPPKSASIRGRRNGKVETWG